MMDSSSDYTSDEDEQYYDATEHVHQEKKEEVVRHLRLDDMFGKGEPGNTKAGEDGDINKQNIAIGEIAENLAGGDGDKQPGKNSTMEEPDSRTNIECNETTEVVSKQTQNTSDTDSAVSNIPNNCETDAKDLECNSPPEIFKLEKCENDNSTVEKRKSQIHSDENINEDGDGTESDDSNKEESIVQDEMTARIEMEAKLSEEEKLERKEQAQQDKVKGNAFFKNQEYLEACDAYTTALELCPLTFKKERSIMHSNRAACRLRLEQLEEAIQDCTEALTLNPLYMKALLRRAQTYELLEKLDESLADYQKALELDPGCHDARSACMRLPDLIKERNEKLKEEMMGKLKDLGNMVLRPFGLSTNNFQFQQDPNTGSYSMNFVQTPRGGNGK